MTNQPNLPFPLRLSQAIEERGHSVYLSDVRPCDWPKRFSTGGALRPDLIVVMGDRWPHRETFPVIGIEAKADADRSISEAVGGVEKVICMRMSAGLSYVIASEGRKPIPRPSTYLLATPMSVREGNTACRWEDGYRGLKWSEESHVQCFEFMEMLLWRFGCGFFKQGKFGINNLEF